MLESVHYEFFLQIQAKFVINPSFADKLKDLLIKHF